MQKQPDSSIYAHCDGAGCQFTHHRTREHLLHHIKCGINTKITYEDLISVGPENLLPRRADFTDRILRGPIKNQVMGNKPVIFLPNDVKEKAEYDRNKRAAIYKAYVFGILPDGSKACVILDDIDVIVDIMVPTGVAPSDFTVTLSNMLYNSNVPYVRMEDKQMYKLHGFQTTTRPWKRIYFNNLNDRKQFLNAVALANHDIKADNERRSRGSPQRELYETASDDQGSGDFYFAKVARESEFSVADWNRFEKYSTLVCDNMLMEGIAGADIINCDYVFRVSVRDYVRMPKDKKEEIISNAAHPLSSVLTRDNTLVQSWDMETYRTIQNGEAPRPEDTDWNIFMICSTFSWHHTDRILFDICCVDVDTNVSVPQRSDMNATKKERIGLTVVCGNEERTLLAHADIIGTMRPDLMIAFNGANFDWPLYREKMKRYKRLVYLKERASCFPVNRSGKWADTDDNVYKWCFQPVEFKIDAETKHKLECVAQFAGIIDLDIRPIFMKLFPKAEVRFGESLNFYLKQNKLESKEDMPYELMFRVYEYSHKLSGNYIEQRMAEEIQSQKVANPSATIDRASVYSNIHAMRTEDIRAGIKKMLTEYRRYVVKEICEIIHYDIFEDPTDPTNFVNAAGEIADITTLSAHIDAMTFEQLSQLLKNLMWKVAYYCKIDSWRTQQLIVKRTLLPDRREMSNMACVKLYDSIYRADGMKVRNFVGHMCHEYNIAFSNGKNGKKDEDKDAYPGGFVFIPIRGLHIDYPITGLDFSSLYPSLMMAYNLSPDMTVETAEEAEMLRKKGYALHHIKPFNYKKHKQDCSCHTEVLTKEGWTVRHNGIYKKDDKKIIDHIDKVVDYELYRNVTDDYGNVIKVKVTEPPRMVDDYGNEIVMTTKTKTGYRFTVTDPEIVNDKPGQPSSPDSYHVVDPATEGILPPDVDAIIKQWERMNETISAAYSYSRKVDYKEVYGRDALPGERMGICAYIVKELFDVRKPLKDEFVRLSKLKEAMLLEGVRVKKTIDPNTKKEVELDLETIEFMIAKIDSKQKAVKVLMNTFYGESGNYRSSLYQLLVAAGITCAGQENIKRVHAYVTARGCAATYGDTDSVYLKAPKKAFEGALAQYEQAIRQARAAHAESIKDIEVLGNDPAARQMLEEAEHTLRQQLHAAKITYWTQLVRITMTEVTRLQEQVADYLMWNNGTKFLKVAYEEVGFPTVLCGKKKYFMTPHIATVNFDIGADEIFIRGIDIIKQGQSQLAKTLGYSLMLEALMPDNEKTLIELVMDGLKRFYTHKWDTKMFVLNAKYKPHKKNVPVQRFVARMKEISDKFMANGDYANAALYKPPEPGEKFQFVIVRKEQKYTLRGTLIEIKKGDQMEFLRVYEESQKTPNPMEIDLTWYMESSIEGLFARFIVYHPDFQPPASMGWDPQDKEQYKLIDQYCVDQAVKFIKNYCASLSGLDRNVVKKIGKDYRKIYSNVTKALNVDLTKKIGRASELFQIVQTDAENLTAIVDQLKQIPPHMLEDKLPRCTKLVKRVADSRIRDHTNVYVNSNDVDNPEVIHMTPFAFYKYYNSDVGFKLSEFELELCKKREADIVDQMFKTAAVVSKIVKRYEHDVIVTIEDMRRDHTASEAGEVAAVSDDEVKRINRFSDEEVAALNKLQDLRFKYIANVNLRSRVQNMVAAINNARHALVQDEIDASREFPSEIKAAKESIKKISVIEDYEFV